jgi:hypothetical protein
MEMRRIEPKGVMLDAKAGPTFVDASLAENDRLLAARERFADNGPFLEGDAALAG